MSFIQHIKPSVQKLEAYSLKSAPFSPDLIKLNQNENPFDLPDTIKREIVEDFFLQQWNRYPEVLPLKLIEEISKYLSISEESIIAANGSNELMYTILMAIISKGTKVLIPIPTFFLYEKIVEVFEGTLVRVSANVDLSFDVQKIISTALIEKPSIIILNTPNSPTGQMLSLKDIENIISSTDAIILVDEAYIEFADLPSAVSLIQKYDRLVILRTFSKAYSLASLRIGFLLTNPALCKEFKKPKIPFTVNNFSSGAAIKLMQQKEMILERIRYIKLQRDYLFKELSAIKTIKVFSSQTNFLIFQMKNRTDVLLDKLLNDNILIRDVGSYPMLENTLRVNVGTEVENTTFISVLKKHL